MRLAPEFSLRTLPAAADQEGKSALLRDGRDTGAVLSGEELAAAVALDRSETLVLVLYGEPYEESLTATLLGGDFATLDEATIGWAGTTGTFRDLVLSPPDRLSFRFYAEGRYEIVVHPRPVWRLPFPGLPPGIWRPFRPRRRFDLRRRD